MDKVALVIIYNHQYNKNIDVLERIYKGRFSNIYHIVPFYTGDKPNVIPVYENSHYFQGYVSQGLKSYFSADFAHYFFVADDMILNPVIDETNYQTHLRLNKNTCFIPEFVRLHELKHFWPHTEDAYFWKMDVRGVEVQNQLPDYQSALQKFHRFGLTPEPLRFPQIWWTPRSYGRWLRHFFGRNAINHTSLAFRALRSHVSGKRYPLTYPMIGSYSDIFVISADAIQQFCHYCGVFAATKLFVEIALPTSVVLSAKEIVTENDLALQGKALWTKEELQEFDKYGNSLKRLIDGFPANYLYLHPVKLSKWEKDL